MEEKIYKVVIVGGGTGGHLFPGIAVAEEFKKRVPNVEIVFMGAKRGIEAKVLPRERYYVKLLNIEGFVGVSFKKKTVAFFKFVYSLFVSYFFLRKINPNVVIGTGAYASFPPVFTASIMGIATVILEQNSMPGLGNRILAKFADKVCVTYENSLAFFPKDRTFLTGNPVRESILNGDRGLAINTFSLARGKFTILIFGGSSGASSINKAVVEALEYLTDLKDHIQFLHQTGEKDYEKVKSAYLQNGFSGTITPFIYQMNEAYVLADLVVSRAGATTLAEITAIGIASILIPYPHAYASHQEINASKLASNRAAIMMKDIELSGATLSKKLRELILNKELRNQYRLSALSLGKPDSVKKVVGTAINAGRQNKES